MHFHSTHHCPAYKCKREHALAHPHTFTYTTHDTTPHSLGCVLLVVYGAQIMWETMSKYRFIILMGILLITAAFTCKTITRNRDWYSRECLLRAGLRVLPHNAKMHYNFGNFLKDSFQHDTAKQHYREALRFLKRIAHSLYFPCFRCRLIVSV